MSTTVFSFVTFVTNVVYIITVLIVDTINIVFTVAGRSLTTSAYFFIPPSQPIPNS